MSTSALLRLCGLAAVLAGVLFIASDFLDFTVDPATDSSGFGADAFAQETPSALLVFQSGLTLLAGMLLLFGSIGLYVSRLEWLGLPGLFGFVLAFSGTVMAVGSFWSDTFVAPTLAAALAQQPSGLLDATPPRALAAGLGMSYGLVSVGWFLFGLASLQDKSSPRAASTVLMLGATLTWLPFPLTGVPFSVGLAWLGWHLYSTDPLDQPDRL